MIRSRIHTLMTSVAKCAVRRWDLVGGRALKVLHGMEYSCPWLYALTSLLPGYHALINFSCAMPLWHPVPALEPLIIHWNCEPKYTSSPLNCGYQGLFPRERERQRECNEDISSILLDGNVSIGRYINT